MNHLLAVCDAPHEAVEISIACCAQVEVLDDGSQDPGWVFASPWVCASIASFLAIF